MSPDEKTQKELELAAKETETAAVNKSRTGVGLRQFVGQTRGRNTTVITYEGFDESQPATLPKDLSSFMEVTKTTDEPTIMAYLITGFNDAQYKAASDEIGEFVEPTWTKEQAAQFRMVIRNYSKGAGVSLQEAVDLIKPGFSKGVAAQ